MAAKHNAPPVATIDAHWLVTLQNHGLLKNGHVFIMFESPRKFQTDTRPRKAISTKPSSQTNRASNSQQEEEDEDEEEQEEERGIKTGEECETQLFFLWRVRVCVWIC